MAIAERAYQQAVDFARNRVQGRALGDGKAAATIIHHPDVRRMLLGMKAQIEAGRALTYFAAATLDTAKRHPDAAERQTAQALVDLLTPVVKAWCTDVGCDVASTGVQIHGGMGFVEETGAAQHLRDARIAPIYEGTNGIQAADLVFRKVARDGGRSAAEFLAQVAALDVALAGAEGDDMRAIRTQLKDGLDALRDATDWIASTAKSDPTGVAAGSAHYLRMFGLVAGGFMMARAALEAVECQTAGIGDPELAAAKRTTARFYAEQFLPQTRGLLAPIREGHATVMTLAEDRF